MKNCPYCAEEIQDNAVYCRYCRHWLNIPISSGDTDSNVDFRIGHTQSETISRSPSRRNKLSEFQTSKREKAILWFILLMVYSILYSLFLYQFLIGNLQKDPYATTISIMGFGFAVLLISNWLKNIWSVSGFVRFILSLVIAFILHNLIGFVIGFTMGLQAGFWQAYYTDLFSGTNTSVKITATSSLSQAHAGLGQSDRIATEVSKFKTTENAVSLTPTINYAFFGDCHIWSSISLDDVGTRMCVFGKAINTFNKDKAFFIVFGNSQNDFYLISYVESSYDGMKGNCVAAEGEIKQLGQTPVMVVEEDQLFKCE